MSETKAVAVKTGKSALQVMAERLSVSSDVLQTTLKQTAFKECKTNEEFVAAVIVANTYRLNPLLKEIYAFPSKGGGVVPVIPIDGWISMANRNKRFDGVELVDNFNDAGEFVSVTAKFHLKEINNPVIVTEHLDECKRETDTWKKYPRRMLRHKAYIQGARIAFGFSGVYDEDEAARIVEAITVNPKANVAMPQAKPIETDAIPIEKGETENQYKQMLKNFEAAKKIHGEELYYAVLNTHGIKHSNEIRSLDLGRQIIAEIIDISAQAEKESK